VGLRVPGDNCEGSMALIPNVRIQLLIGSVTTELEMEWKLINEELTRPVEEEYKYTQDKPRL
jgi:hypothetical protein